MPLIRVMGQTQWKSCCPEGGEIGIILKCRILGIEAWLGRLDFSHGDDIRRRHGPRGRLLEECRRQIIGKILLDKLRELRCLDRRNQSGCIRGSQHKEAAKGEQFVLDNRATDGSTELISSKGWYCAAPN